MAKTVDAAFEDYLRRIVPLRTESQAARGHQSSVGTCLTARFDGARIVATGSTGRGTALRRHSDADYFLVLPRSVITNDSAEMLRRVRSALRHTFPKTNISVSKPAIVVPFGRDGCESLDIVPAVFAMRTPGGYDVFDIPDGAGGWMRSSPGAEKAYVNALDVAHNGHVKPLIMLVKVWKAQWNVPIRGYYLEMRVAKYTSSVKSIEYARGIERVFESMIGPNGLADLRDPTGVGSLIRPCLTEKQAGLAFLRAQRALARATEARKSEAMGNITKAFERWNLFFNHTFPAYK